MYGIVSVYHDEENKIKGLFIRTKKMEELGSHVNSLHNSVHVSSESFDGGPHPPVTPRSRIRLILVAKLDFVLLLLVSNWIKNYFALNMILYYYFYSKTVHIKTL